MFPSKTTTSPLSLTPPVHRRVHISSNLRQGQQRGMEADKQPCSWCLHAWFLFFLTLKPVKLADWRFQLQRVAKFSSNTVTQSGSIFWIRPVEWVKFLTFFRTSKGFLFHPRFSEKKKKPLFALTNRLPVAGPTSAVWLRDSHPGKFLDSPEVPLKRPQAGSQCLSQNWNYQYLRPSLKLFECELTQRRKETRRSQSG